MERKCGAESDLLNLYLRPNREIFLSPGCRRRTTVALVNSLCHKISNRRLEQAAINRLFRVCVIVGATLGPTSAPLGA